MTILFVKKRVILAKTLFIFIFLLLVDLQNGYAQRLTYFSGTVIDSLDQTPLASAVLRFKTLRDTNTVFSTLTQDNGKFEIQLPAGGYVVTISYIGYKPLKQVIAIKSSTPPAIFALVEQTQQLKTVDIIGKLPPAVQKGDTTEFNARAFKVNPDATSEDLIRKMPGITIENGQVKARGEDVKKITVDGQEFFGDDANAALRNLPADVVDKVQIFDRMTDQAQMTGFDDGRSFKAINIITKSDKRMGRFGRAYMGYGTDDRFNAGGVVNEFQGKRRISLIGMTNNINQQNFGTQDLLGVTGGGNPGVANIRQLMSAPGRFMLGAGINSGMMGTPGGPDFNVAQQRGISETHAIGLNYTDKWKEKAFLNASWFTNTYNNNNLQTLVRNYFLNEQQGTRYDQYSQTVSRNENHRFNIRFEYKPDTLRSLLIVPKLNLQNFRSDANQTAESTLETRLLNNTTNKTASTNAGYSFSNDLIYRHGFKKRGRILTGMAVIQLSDRNADARLKAQNSFIRLTTVTPILQNFAQDRTTNAAEYTFSGAVYYSEPISKTSVLQLDYNSIVTNAQSDQRTLGLDTLTGVFNRLDTLLSNTFDNINYIQRGTLSYRYRAGKAVLVTGVTYQNVLLTASTLFPNQSDIRRPFNSALPHAILRVEFSKKSNMRLIYRTFNAQPSVSQLQNVIDNANPLLLTGGNKNLLQDYSHFFLLRYSYTHPDKGLTFSAMGNYTMTDNYIGNSTLIATQDSFVVDGIALRNGAQYSKPVNLNGHKTGRGSINVGFPWRDAKLNLNFTTTANLNHVPGRVNNQNNFLKTFGLVQGLAISSNISEKIDYLALYQLSVTFIRNTMQPDFGNRFYVQTAYFRLNLLLPYHFTFQTDVNWNRYTGITDNFNFDYTLMGAGIGRRLLKNRNLEIRASIFDLLGTNTNFIRTPNDAYIEDLTSNVVRRYYMLSAIWKFNQFKKPNTPTGSN